jgi:hypothetical protein
MTADPRGALAALVTAFERHLEASASKRGEEDPTVIAAYDDLADAFATYDDALLQAYGEMTPLDIYDVRGRRRARRPLRRGRRRRGVLRPRRRDYDEDEEES